MGALAGPWGRQRGRKGGYRCSYPEMGHCSHWFNQRCLQDEFGQGAIEPTYVNRGIKSMNHDLARIVGRGVVVLTQNNI